jgi:hypothetical protein
MAGGQEDADARGRADAYLSLSELLLAVLARGDDPDEAGRRAGRLIGRAGLGNGSGAGCDGPAELEKFLQSRGFMPKQIGSGPETGFVLGCCPYKEAALANPSLICGLHRTLAEGILDSHGGAFEVARLIARHPTTAGCRLELRAADQVD